MLQLCRDVYHCTPLELMQQPADVVSLHMWMLGVIEEHRPRDSGGKKR